MTTSRVLINNEIQPSFLGWQCRIRQIAMRRDNGRPSPGMQPRVISCDGKEILEKMTVLIRPKAATDSIAFFRHQLRKSNDPKLVRERGLTYLQSTHYQKSQKFSDKITALFFNPSPTADTLIEEKKCILEFAQSNQTYCFQTNVRALDSEDEGFQATIWHNRLFNPNIPHNVYVLEFQPSWDTAQSNP